MPRLNATNPRTSRINRYSLFFIEISPLLDLNNQGASEPCLRAPDSLSTYSTIKAYFELTLTSRQRHRLSRLHVCVFEKHYSDQRQRPTAHADRYAPVATNRDQWSVA